MGKRRWRGVGGSKNGEKREEESLKCRLVTGRMEGCHDALSVTGLQENQVIEKYGYYYY